jgi:hypothetical protein
LNIAVDLAKVLEEKAAPKVVESANAKLREQIGVASMFSLLKRLLDHIFF